MRRLQCNFATVRRTWTKRARCQRLRAKDSGYCWQHKRMAEQDRYGRRDTAILGGDPSL